MNKFSTLCISIGAPLLTGFLGSLATSPNLDAWYATLTKPAFNPPNWVFGPVWTILYILMGIALYRIWTRSDQQPSATKAIQLFFVHLAVNLFWSVAFFGLQNPLLGLLTIVVLLLLIIRVIKRFSQIDKTAGYLLYPYLAWVTFATALNVSIWYLN